MIEKKYIFASCKTWHKRAFLELQDRDSESWDWASNPDELLELTTKISPRYIFFLHWNWKVPESIWSNFECVCFHMTDVPFGRGGSPLQNLIALGLKETQLSALRMVEDMDAGPVYAKKKMSLHGRAEEIYLRAGLLSMEIIRSMLLGSGFEPTPQEGEPVLFKRRTPEDSLLPSAGNIEGLYDHIRMLDAPTYPLAFVEHGGFIIEFSHAELKNGEIDATALIRTMGEPEGQND